MGRASDFGLFGTASLLLHEWPPGMRQFRVMLSSLGQRAGRCRPRSRARPWVLVCLGCVDVLLYMPLCQLGMGAWVLCAWACML